LRTIDWYDGKVIDWNSAGKQYLENGETQYLQQYHYGFVCDGSITSENGEFVLIYQKRRTKGLLLKNGELWREINRTYYQSDVYEFPAAFFTYQGRTYLAHCPNEYNQIDFEDAETGEIVTNIPDRELEDVFHSRLEVSPDNKFLLSKGWVWQPMDVIVAFDIEKCFENPKLLDEVVTPDSQFEVNVASFLDDNRVIIGSSRDKFEVEDAEGSFGQLAIWNIETDEVTNRICVKEAFGNVFSIDEEKCWDVYDYPKIIDLNTGEIIDKIEEIDSGKQDSSIMYKDIARIAFDRSTKQLAIATGDAIEIVKY